MLMSCTEKHRKWEMHSVEHCIWVLCTEKPRKSDWHTVEHSVKCTLWNIVYECVALKHIENWKFPVENTVYEWVKLNNLENKAGT